MGPGRGTYALFVRRATYMSLKALPLDTNMYKCTSTEVRSAKFEHRLAQTRT